jgi:HSP20 family protein
MTSRDPTTWMWAEACELLERADRLHRQFFWPGAAQATRATTWEPPVDIFETEHELWILVALPGVAPEHIQIVIDAGALIVSGERPMPAEARAARIRRLEIPYGHLERRVELPARRFELKRRDFQNGCLMIGLNKLG